MSESILNEMTEHELENFEELPEEIWKELKVEMKSGINRFSHNGEHFYLVSDINKKYGIGISPLISANKLSLRGNYRLISGEMIGKNKNMVLWINKTAAKSIMGYTSRRDIHAALKSIFNIGKDHALIETLVDKSKVDVSTTLSDMSNAVVETGRKTYLEIFGTDHPQIYNLTEDNRKWIRISDVYSRIGVERRTVSSIIKRNPVIFSLHVIKDVVYNRCNLKRCEQTIYNPLNGKRPYTVPYIDGIGVIHLLNYLEAEHVCHSKDDIERLNAFKEWSATLTSNILSGNIVPSISSVDTIMREKQNIPSIKVVDIFQDGIDLIRAIKANSDLTSDEIELAVNLASRRIGCDMTDYVEYIHTMNHNQTNLLSETCSNNNYISSENIVNDTIDDMQKKINVLEEKLKLYPPAIEMSGYNSLEVLKNLDNIFANNGRAT